MRCLPLRQHYMRVICSSFQVARSTLPKSPVTVRSVLRSARDAPRHGHLVVSLGVHGLQGTVGWTCPRRHPGAVVVQTLQDRPLPAGHVDDASRFGTFVLASTV